MSCFVASLECDHDPWMAAGHLPPVTTIPHGFWLRSHYYAHPSERISAYHSMSVVSKIVMPMPMPMPLAHTVGAEHSQAHVHGPAHVIVPLAVCLREANQPWFLGSEAVIVRLRPSFSPQNNSQGDYLLAKHVFSDKRLVSRESRIEHVLQARTGSSGTTPATRCDRRRICRRRARMWTSAMVWVTPTTDNHLTPSGFRLLCPVACRCIWVNVAAPSRRGHRWSPRWLRCEGVRPHLIHLHPTRVGRSTMRGQWKRCRAPPSHPVYGRATRARSAAGRAIMAISSPSPSTPCHHRRGGPREHTSVWWY